MGKSSASTVHKRITEVVGLLKSRDAWTTQELSRELGISQRTLMRDLSSLREQGYPLEADRGRGGGIRLQRNWSVGKLNLNYREALDLLLSLAVMEKLQSPLLLKHLRSIRNKIAISFSDADRKRVISLRKRILVGEAVSQRILATYGPCVAECLERLHGAFFEMRCLEIEYLDEKAQSTKRIIEPHFLHYCPPIWYVLGWDRSRQDARTFRIDRIKRAAIQPASFSPRHQDSFLKPIAHFSAAL
jgi:predicted DNA-binding transcriptional regulator YafY